ncbi:MAG: glycosyltransferase family 4 protein [Thermodesulfobacteriota bacterium]
MRILYVCSVDLSGQAGSLGSVNHVMEVAGNLARLGHEVVLVAPGYARYVSKPPVPVVYVPAPRMRFLRTILHEALTPLIMIWLLLRFQPDAVYWRQAYLTIFPVLLARLWKKPVVTEVNGLTLDEVESEPLSALRKKTILAFEAFNYRLSTRLICVAPRIRERIVTHYRLPPEKALVILNGVNADRMPVKDQAEARAGAGLPADGPLVGFVGHFFPWDGIETLIEAAPAVREKFPDVRFVIVGHGRWGEHLPALAREKGVSESFIFTGKVEWARLYLYLNALDVAVAPYSAGVNEQSGRSSLKILEYFACRKPVVSSFTDAIPEVLTIREKGLGLTVRPEDPEGLAAALIRLLGDPDMRETMGRGGREYVVSERSWKGVAEKTAAILSELSGRGRG